MMNNPMGQPGGFPGGGAPMGGMGAPMGGMGAPMGGAPMGGAPMGGMGGPMGAAADPRQRLGAGRGAGGVGDPRFQQGR